MRKVYKKLTKEQKTKGVIFSSQLQPGGTAHEVFKNDENKHKVIARLEDDKFFNNSSNFKYNEIRN